MSTMVELGLNSVNNGIVDRAMLPTVWQQISHIMYEKGTGLVEYTEPHEIYNELLHEKMLLWLGVGKDGIELVVLLQIMDWPKKRELLICWVGGSHLIKHLKAGILSKIEEYACMINATRVVAVVRPGLLRVLKKYGYGSTRVEISKPVSILWRH